MDFLLQINSFDNIDTTILKEILERRKRLSGFTEMTMHQLSEAGKEEVEGLIPVGTIPFIEAWLKKCHGINRINPIEIPKFLRTEEFLKREYSIVPYYRIPRGVYFVKDVTALKEFAFEGDTEELFTGRIAGTIDRSHMFQVSEPVDILSEYRVYVIDGQIENVCNYNGSPLIFPDMELVSKANSIYMTKPDYPGSLTIDVMVTERGTSLIETHPFVSVGLYSTLWSDRLLNAYRDGIRYVLEHNSKIIP